MENSKINWTDHTWNPWVGCRSVSAECDHCYADTMVTNRMGRDFGTVQRTKTWKDPKMESQSICARSGTRSPSAGVQRISHGLFYPGRRCMAGRGLGGHPPVPGYGLVDPDKTTAVDSVATAEGLGRRMASRLARDYMRGEQILCAPGRPARNSCRDLVHFSRTSARECGRHQSRRLPLANSGRRIRVGISSDAG